MKDKFLHSLANAINNFLSLKENNKKLLPKLVGTCFKIELEDLKQHLYLVFTEHGVSIFAEQPLQVPDASIAGRTLNILGAGINADPTKVKLSGDRRKAKTLQTILNKIELPITELVQKTFGEKIGYWFESGFSALKSSVHRSKKTVITDIDSLITEELGLTVTQEEFVEFKQRVKACRDRLARLEKCV